MSKKKKYRVISLFSGAGGMDLGFINAGFDIVWANDFGLRSTIADYIVLSMFIFFLVIAFSGKISNANYMCKDCNKRFYHK